MLAEAEHCRSCFEAYGIPNQPIPCPLHVAQRAKNKRKRKRKQ